MNPGTFIANQFLYAFQGFNISNEIVKTIERLNISKEGEKWQEILVKNSQDLGRGSFVMFPLYNMEHYIDPDDRNKVLVIGGWKPY